MRAVVLAGGLGTRINNPEKCLLPVGGVPLILRVVGALQWAGATEIYVATTRRHVGVTWLAQTWGLEVVETPGRGYEKDFAELAARLAPAVFTACDLANLEPRHIKPLVEAGGFATAVAEGRYIGLSYVTGDLTQWTEVEIPDVINVNTIHDLERAEASSPTVYPLAVWPDALRPHEETLPHLVPDIDTPIAVDAWTCTVMDGHHRLEHAKRRRVPIPVVPMDYRVVEVNLNKLEITARAATSALLPPKTTWHTYKGRHVSQMPAARGLPKATPLKCNPL